MKAIHILFSGLLCTLLPVHANAADGTSNMSIEIERRHFGSGTPAPYAVNGADEALPVADGLYHAPNYMPGFPTAATIWPREMPVNCEHDTDSEKISCDGYQVLPAVGRGEYLFIRPVVKVSHQEPPPPPPPPRPEPKLVPVTKKKPLG